MAYVMVVDDDEDFATAVATVLRAAGHEVSTLHDPEAALSAMNERTPEVVVLDVMFPESVSGGFDVARLMAKPNSHLNGVPILMLTAVNSRFPLGFSSRDIDSDWLPVADFVEKPLDLATLPDRVNALLTRVTARK